MRVFDLARWRQGSGGGTKKQERAPVASPALRNSEAAGAGIAAFAGLSSAYWDDSWHTTLGRDSALIPPHLLLYTSILFVGLMLALWGWRMLRASHSITALFRAPGFMLALAAAAATLFAAPADAFWHTSFGRDAVLWSPPHLLSVIATIVLLIALLIGMDPAAAWLIRISVAAALVGSAQIVVMEYDTNVPQFSETFYLPLLLLLSLGSAWIIAALLPIRLVVTATVIVYVAFRILVWVALGSVGWIAPDLPVALAGLVVLDARAGVWRWPLAAVAVTALQLIASAIGVSSVSFAYAAQSAAVILLALALVAAVLATRRYRVWRVGAAAVLVAVSLFVGTAPSPAQAHDPGQGPSFGSATMSVTGTGDGRIRVTVSDIEAAGAEEWTEKQLIARRAGQAVTGDLGVESGGSLEFTGSIVLPSEGLWFVYAQFSDHGQTLELWMPVDRQLDVDLAERRNVYEPVGEEAVVPAQAAVGALLLGVGAALTVAAVVAVWRRRRDTAEVKP
jgi:hypothetical protein